jgi:hypothetical protein
MSRYPFFFLLAIAGALALAGCGKPAEAPAPQTAEEPAPAAADTSHDAAMAAKEQEIAQREQELAKREADVAAQEAAQKKPAAAPAVKKPVAAPAKTAPAAATSAATTAKETVKPAPTPIVVPAGTQLTVALNSDLSTKTAKAGDTFEAHLVSDLMAGGRRAAPAGSLVMGTVTDVISGSKTIGGTPTLGLRLHSLVLESQQKVAINGELVEKGKSDTLGDTAKIVGGAAAGAIIGHQVDSGSSGKVVGGLLGGAIGAVIAKNTGAEVELKAGSTLTIALTAPIEIHPR